MFKFRKKDAFIYEDFVNEISKQLRYYNLSQFENDITGKRKTVLEYNLNDLNKLLKSTTVKTKKLLSEKGFSSSINNRVDKAVLLNTEISELADAVKKGLGVESEGLELADIVIRAVNFLCLDETYEDYIKLCELVSNNAEHSFEKISIAITIPDINNRISSKYCLIEDMMMCWVEIKKASEMLEVCFINNLDYKNFSAAFIILWNKIVDLIAYCNCYATVYLPENLQFYVDTKMDKNFKRPFKYGVCEEHK